MPKILREYPWKISYTSNTHNTITDFYIPALECAIQYDRKAGFFSSAILSKVARGLGAMLHNKGQIRLIMGCQFSPQDLQAIQQGYELRDALLSRLDADLKPPESFAQLKHLEILSWLIQNQYLDIKIAIPLKENGLPEDSTQQLDPQHIFHEKVGIFTDSKGEKLAFNGSNNESIGGWERNVESFHVYCSWEGGRELDRVEEEVARFEQLWYDVSPNVRVFEVPEAVQKKLLRYAKSTKPDWNAQAEFDSRPLTKIELTEPEAQPEPELKLDSSAISTEVREEERLAFTQLANIHEHPGCLDFCLKSIPIHPWPHQIKILRRVAQKFPQSFLIADEVGLGKTIETGLILRYLLLSKKVKRVLILAPASVQPQWQEELREKFNLHFWSYTSTEFKDPYKRTIPAAANPWNTQDLILASSHLVRRTDRMQQLLSAEPWDLVILDEAHHARRKSPQDRKETPNRLLQLMTQLKEKTKSLILLSATPMQIDAIEVFDLLNLLGLQGHWSYGDNFCYYFASLQGAVKQEVTNFWQVMSSDYFQRGGQPSSRLEQFLTKSDRILAYKMQDTWQRGKKISNHKQLLADEDFIDTSRQYLTVNTPLKDLMFRHTRDTLRQYYKRGLLERDIPTRVVQDNAITLEPQREVPLYVAVSDYVRHFYRLAQLDQRSCLGFLMTLYRKRLTSSFYAIKSSLQRRLDYLLTQRGSVLSDDDLVDVDNEDDAVIAGLESFFEPVDPQEIQYLEELLRQFENTGEDSKLSRFIQILRQELTDRESAIVFTQYTDTMDYLRDTLKELYGSQVACYSGRGGELYQNGEWCLVPKEEIKRRFRQDEIKILLCTESASEGLNLQNCGVLINYDMPWNPMRVEQRIGRIDRIGQRYPTVRIHNFYYDGTVEAKVYRKLRDRINAFATVVGNLQPILAQVPTFIERAVMSADPEEEDVLMSQFDSVLDSPPPRLAIEEMVAMDLDADLAEIQKPIPSTPFTSEAIEQLFTDSAILKASGVQFERKSERTWQLNYKGQNYTVTFYPNIFDEMPSLRLMNFGDPLFEELLTRQLSFFD
ncbi:DEAD/DEAH box helicase family protein [Nostoc sp. UCD121]|uniref:DEAD/DEAH box helicase n=1 Tax=unclassified Nostoc TaxID=2593658 RepID=UPI00162A5F4B|nr:MULTISPECIES: helicase-related protein [unclassified Nostoc]MBC1225181.1 DEAD/DEAH box helicase family protein [Nostoc sp. UCD120]MBC1279096.1 DEAD/DEAH box helicase family protein [Nostoc sp. UCD121]MBC1298099.1 DEAD/DEAH box helicase family protein [Nostoc sp. UCD122]